MFLLNLQSKVPIYEQIQTQILRFIEAGVLRPGDKLPSVRQLAQENGINPNTAVRIYQELEREGVCRTRRGLGTFVTEDEGRIRLMKEEMARSAVERVIGELAGLGFSRMEAAKIILEETENAEK